MEDRQEWIQEGLTALASGKLRRLREKFNLTYPVLAHLIGVDPTALRRWEAGERQPSQTSLEKIGRWALQAQGDTRDMIHDPHDLVPMSLATQVLGMSYATVLQKCQNGEISCVDLGALGIYVLRKDLPGLPTEGAM